MRLFEVVTAAGIVSMLPPPIALQGNVLRDWIILLLSKMTIDSVPYLLAYALIGLSVRRFCKIPL